MAQASDMNALLRPSRRLSLHLAICLLLLAGGCAQNDARLEQNTVQVVLAGERFELELALTPEQQFQGLSDRPSIADRGGMLFVFRQPAVRAFVMRRCLVPIDILYLSSTGRIVKTHAMQVETIDWENDSWSERDLTRYSSVWPAQFVIEIQGGLIEALGLSEGQQVDLPLEKLAAMLEQ